MFYWMYPIVSLEERGNHLYIWQKRQKTLECVSVSHKMTLYKAGKNWVKKPLQLKSRLLRKGLGLFASEQWHSYSRILKGEGEVWDETYRKMNGGRRMCLGPQALTDHLQSRALSLSAWVAQYISSSKVWRWRKTQVGTSSLSSFPVLFLIS